MSVFEIVQEKAEALGISVKQLEVISELSNGTIYGWKTSKPYAESLRKVANVLNCSMEELMPEKEE